MVYNYYMKFNLGREDDEQRQSYGFCAQSLFGQPLSQRGKDM